MRCLFLVDDAVADEGRATSTPRLVPGRECRCANEAARRPTQQARVQGTCSVVGVTAMMRLIVAVGRACGASKTRDVRFRPRAVRFQSFRSRAFRHEDDVGIMAQRAAQGWANRARVTDTSRWLTRSASGGETRWISTVITCGQRVLLSDRSVQPAWCSCAAVVPGKTRGRAPLAIRRALAAAAGRHE